jgi:hypothetical protein
MLLGPSLLLAFVQGDTSSRQLIRVNRRRTLENSLLEGQKNTSSSRKVAKSVAGRAKFETSVAIQGSNSTSGVVLGNVMHNLLVVITVIVLSVALV